MPQHANRLSALALFLALAATGPAMADRMTGHDWQLLAVDGVVVPAGTTLRIEADGSMVGKAACNSWGARNRAGLPDLALGPIRATRIACPDQAAEQAFFTALAAMTGARLDGSRNLILTAPDGRSLEFVTDRMNRLTVCKTCPPKG